MSRMHISMYFELEGLYFSFPMDIVSLSTAHFVISPSSDWCVMWDALVKHNFLGEGFKKNVSFFFPSNIFLAF